MLQLWTTFSSFSDELPPVMLVLACCSSPPRQGAVLARVKTLPGALLRNTVKPAGAIPSLEVCSWAGPTLLDARGNPRSSDRAAAAFLRRFPS